MREKTIHDILAHAKAQYPNECCGVIAQKSRIERYFPCRNLHSEPKEHFILAPEDYAQAEDWGTITAIVHSHPDATTQPSITDEAQCDNTKLPWVIVSWPEGDIRTIQPRGILPLVGRPFVLGFTDCYGLIMDYFKLEHDITLPDFRVDYCWWEKGENLYVDNFAKAGFVEVETPKTGDVALMQVQADVINHAGIIVDDGMLLHHIYGQLSQRVPYGGYWLERTLKLVRYKKLVNI